MKFPIYSIRDRKSAYGMPILDTNDDTVKRTVYYQAMRDPIMNLHPNDYDIYKIGDMELDSGELIPCQPIFIVCLRDIVNEVKKEYLEKGDSENE